ncbi:MAG: TIR domain-containing protein [Xanthomonadales bacterium]|nr:TIR domain-containing protein [Xanthomonadales bacterium]
MSYQYSAFISYSHADEPWAAWLQRSLERYRTPRRLRAANPGLPSRLKPVFRDKEDLSSGMDLGAVLQEKLRQSEALIVICSPASARSRWTNEEVRYFRQHAPDRQVLCLLVDGSPGDGADAPVFPSALTQGPDGETLPEPLAADPRPHGDGKRLALLKIASALFGVELDDLRQRDQQRRMRFLAGVAAGSALIAVITIALAIAAQLARKDADRRLQQSEDLLGFMVGDLRAQLEPLGQLGILDAVGERAMAHFSSTVPSDLTDEVLASQARVLTQIGEVRLQQARWTDAVAAFAAAYERSAELTERHPGVGERLFDRGQAEFWVGYVLWREGRTDEARDWMNRYLATSQDLQALKPERRDWVAETGYAHHNLAVLSVETGHLEEASRAFAGSVAIARTLLDDNPADTAVLKGLSDSLSWQGTVARNRGRLQEALEFFRESSAVLETMTGIEPENVVFRFHLARSMLFVGQVQALLGELQPAGQTLDATVDLLRDLNRQDPDNRKWRRILSTAINARAQVHVARDELEVASRLLGESSANLEQRIALDDSDRFARRALASARLWSGRIDAARGAPQKAALQFKDAAEMYATLASESDDVAVAIGQGEAVCESLALSDPGSGRQALRAEAQRIVGSLMDRPEQDKPLLRDMLARCRWALGEQQQSLAIIAQLNETGYRPLWPWPGNPE